MGLSPVPTPAVLDALRAATLSDDGLTLTLNGQLDADTYRRVKKALDVYGGKWNRKAGTHDFTKDFRPHLEHLLGGGKIGADNGGKNPLAYFPTPYPVIEEMCKRIWPWAPDARFLEPSAGSGPIAQFLRDRHRTAVDCLELDEDRHAHLTFHGFNVVGRDFLQFTPEQPYDYVLMNPPFTAPGDAHAYITHIEHALTCLKPGGDLVAIVPQGYAYVTQKRVTAFREFCEKHAQSPMHTFPPGTFKGSGTDVTTCLIHITKPEAEEAAMTQPAEQPAPRKTARKSKKAEVPADTQVDFKALAAETRKKMQAGTGKGKKAAAATSTEIHAEPVVAVTFQPGHIVSVDLMTQRMNGVVLGGDDDAGYRVVTKTAESVQPYSALAPGYVRSSIPLKVGDEAQYTGQDLTVPNAGLVIVEGTKRHVMVRDRWDDQATPQALSRDELLVMRRLDVADALADLGISQPGTAPAPADDLPFPVSEAQLEAAVDAGDVVPVLPGTPVLISPADLKPGSLGLHAVPLHQTARSSCNVRHHYDPAAIEELAASLKAEGQIENATGRWNADGQVEIVAGESRRRAQLWREEQGEQGLTLLVNVRELTDAEALSISATENMRRRNMTALEECEAMHRLNEAGRSVEDIATMFGYKSLQPVADRILAARTLHTTARDLLDRGELSLAQAVVIARAPGEDLQLSMTTAATRAYNPASAADLSRQLTRGQFLTKSAKFDVEKSGLEVVRDIFGMFEPYFRDKGKALNAQIEWANARAKLAQAKGKHPFVAVESGSGGAYSALASSRKYTYSYSPQKGVTGLIFYVDTDDGTVSEELSYSLKASAKDAAVKAGQAKADAPSRPISDSAYLEAHERRAAALRESVVGNTHLTLALTVWGLIVNDSVGMAKLGEIHGLPKELEGMPALTAAVAHLRERLRPGLCAKGNSYQQHVLLNGNSSPDRHPLLELLLSLTDEELLEYLNTLTAVTAYEWPQYNNQVPVRAEYAYLASITDAPQRLAQNFKLTDAWLKRYPRHELVAIAEEAGLGRALVEDCGTLKEMRARILEHADALHRAGFVPKLVQFPAPPAPTAQVPQEATPATPATEGDRAALEARARAIIATLNRAQADAVLLAWGWDCTDWDSLEAIKRELPGELTDMTLSDLRENAELWALEPQVATAAETAAD